MKSWAKSFILPVLFFIAAKLHQAQCSQEPVEKQPVIIDTDIGSFLDDSFAIVYAAQSEKLDIKLIVTTSDDTTARAKVTAKLMKLLDRDDVPIGIGLKNDNKTHQYLTDWGAEEDLSAYKGGVFQDGVGKMAEVISNSAEVMDIIAIGPMTNFPMLIKKCPECVKKARVRAMAGSIHVGYDGSSTPAAEYNVYMCPWCMEVLLRAGWVSVTITPLDTCGNVALSSDQVKEMLQGDSRAATALASTLTFFCIQEAYHCKPADCCNLKENTPILFDVIGTLIAIPEVGEMYMNYVDMNLRVNASGYTVVDDEAGNTTSVALSWKDKAEGEFTSMLTKVYGEINS